MKKSKKAFTLIEVIIVIALITLVSVIVIPIGIEFYENEAIERELGLLKKNLELTRDQSIGGKLDSAWSVKLETEQYTIFKGESFEERNQFYDEIFNISSGITIVSGEGIVTFEKISGNSDNHVIILKFGEIERTIGINLEGLVYFD